MGAVRNRIRALYADRRGATAIEYALIASLIVIGMMGGLSLLGGGTDGMWTYISTEIEENM